MPEQPNSILEFWKFAAALSSLVSTRDGWTAIGTEVPRGLSSATTPTPRLHAFDRGSLFASIQPQHPGPGWQPLLNCDAGSTALWTSSDRRSFLFPFDVDRAVAELLIEGYRVSDSRASMLQNLHRLYYLLRPLIPRAIQMRMKRAYTGVQAKLEFPSWPIEEGLEGLRRVFGWCVVRASGLEEVPKIAAWPKGKRFCAVLTHDVETEAGVANIAAIAAIERRLGFRSSWNFVPERYALDHAIIPDLQRQGFEIGVHGLTHDGRLFESQRTFRHRAERINNYGRRWGSDGFRSPACHRNYDWMKGGALQFSYDSSFPDTDPYQPMPGGCCSVFPWFLGKQVELPITLPQDHVVFDVLGDSSAKLWREKTDYIESVGGMALLIVHPDYMLSDDRLREYEKFLLYLRAKEGAWYALPNDVARWWHARASLSLVMENDVLRVTKPRGKIPFDDAAELEYVVAGPQPGELLLGQGVTAPREI